MAHQGAFFSPTPAGGRRHAKLDAHGAFLLAQVTQTNDITMLELAAALYAATCTRAATASLSLADPQRVSLQKTLLASEQDRPDIQKARHE